MTTKIFAMHLNRRILIFLLTFFVLTAHVDFVNAIPKRPNPPRLVNDYTNILSVQEKGQLENALAEFARKTSTQIVVVIVPDLEGNDKSMYAYEIGEEWGVGQKGKDNGLVVLVKPKTASSKGQAFIATGYGLEDVIPDAVTKRIVEDEMIPYFKQNKYFEGIAKGVVTLMELASGKFTPQQYMENRKGKGLGGGAVLVILLFFLLFRIFASAGRRRYYSANSRGSSLPFWLLMGMMSSGSHRGSFNSFSSGSGSFGGGFGGFGGGSFGGGGAGGSW